jgi:DNA-binding CsgD family transcriptional regulator
MASAEQAFALFAHGRGPTTRPDFVAVASPAADTTASSSKDSWLIRLAILRARTSLTNMRLDEASKAISRLNRLLSTCSETHFVRYSPALRLLRAFRLALGDDMEAARSLLGALPAPATNSLAATVLRYADWRGSECEAFAPDTVDYLESPIGGKAIDRIYGLCMSAALAFDRLHLTVSAALAAEALELAQKRYGHHAPLSCLPATLLAQVAYEQGRFEEVEALLRPRMPVIRATGVLECVLRASVLLARSAQHRGRPGCALATLREAEAIARLRGWSRMLPVVSSECARALQVMRRCEDEVLELRTGAQSNPAGSRDVATGVPAAGAPRRFASIESALRQTCNAPADSQDLLIKCLRAGASHGLRMVFVDVGPPIFTVLHNLYHSIAANDRHLADLRPYIATLLKSRPQKNAEDSLPATYRSLSRREAGVLQMIARGMSNKRIAQSLGIAPETVKTHAKGILSKLDTRTRAQAVARAESIGLLELV